MARNLYDLGDRRPEQSDSYAYRGVRYQIADIRAPDANCPQAQEAARAGSATLLALMNGGAFKARRPSGMNVNARILMRDDVSLGSLLVLKGYAEPAGGKPVDWCA